jgi:hypothetical protein
MEQMNRERFFLVWFKYESRRVRGTDDKVSRANYKSDPKGTGSCLEP